MINLFSKIDGNDFKIPKAELNQSSFDNILQIVFGLGAAIAILVVVLGALKYVTSQGDPAEVSKAKNTILYAIIGLVIAAAAFSIVTFVVREVS